MSAVDAAREMALYNKWQNKKLYGLCAELSEAERMADRGMFFGSIHHTLDHILLIDELLWPFIVTGERPFSMPDPKQVRIPDVAELTARRAAFDAAVLAHLDTVSADWFDETFDFYHEPLKRNRSIPRQLYVTQMFNHATHHRSQVTSELHRMGIDYGNTDLPYNPLSQY